jgi:very-short-patch-repair endonuclease
LRTIIDVAAVCTPDELEQIVDRALASQLVSLEAISAELVRIAAPGRPGILALRSALSWRSPAGITHSSVLESRALRLLHRAGLRPLAVEAKAPDDLRYRVDILLRPGLAMEVDGYSYHHSPEQMTEDARRRNRLLASGTRVLVYTWRDITHDGHRVIAELRNALAQADGSASATA